MLQTYPVRQPSQGKRGADEVAELPGAVIGGGIVVDVIMNVLFVYPVVGVSPVPGRFFVVFSRLPYPARLL